MQKCFCAVLVFGLVMFARPLLPTAVGAGLSSTVGGGELAGPTARLENGVYYRDLVPPRDKATLPFTFSTSISAAEVESATLSITGTVEMFVGKHTSLEGSTCPVFVNSNDFTGVLATDYGLSIVGTSTLFALDNIEIFETHPSQGLPGGQIGHSTQAVDVTNAIRQVLTSSGPATAIPVQLQFTIAPCNIVFFKFTSARLEITLAPPPKPDLVATSFNYQVLEDQKGDPNGPLPVNAHINFTAKIANQGTQDAGPFNIRFYLSQDSDIDPADTQLVLRTPSGTDMVCHINSLSAGQTQTIECVVDMSRITLAQKIYHGNVWVGMVIDADDNVDETDEDNNANQGVDIDIQPVTLYDPIFEIIGGTHPCRRRRIINPGFLLNINRNQLAQFLRLQGFRLPIIHLTPVPVVIPEIDPGIPAFSKTFSKPMVGNGMVSWFNGQLMPSEAFRIEASIPSSDPPRILLQGCYQQVGQGPSLRWIPTEGEPSPRWAELNPGPLLGWVLYVLDYHTRF